MSQRSALILSAALTAFVLFIAGAVIGRFSRAEVATVEAAVTASPEAEVSSEPPAAADLQELTSQEAQMYLDREAAYRELVRQANERLQAAYAQLQTQAIAPAAATAPALIAPDLAASIALQAAPGAALLTPPVLTTFQNLPAYQVALTTGVVMIDAQSGKILFIGAPTINANTGPGGGSLRARADDRPEAGQGEHIEAEHEQENEGGDH
jgi:hypothetical protein